MLKLLTTPQAQTVIWLAVLAILSVVGIYVVKRFRDQSGEDGPQANELMTNFREMHLRGDIDEKEFRQLKTVLGTQLQDELSESDEEE